MSPHGKRRTDITDAFKQLLADEHGRVVLKNAHEVEYWKQHLGVSEEALREAIAAVGNAAPAVRHYLADRGRG